MAVFEEHFAFVEDAVVVFVGEAEDTIFIFGFEIGIRKTFNDPYTAPVIEVEGDRLHEVWLGSKEADAKTFRDSDFLERVARREWFVERVLGIRDPFGQSRSHGDCAGEQEQADSLQHGR
jgi:hypothetical protein